MERYYRKTDQPVSLIFTIQFKKSWPKKRERKHKNYDFADKNKYTVAKFIKFEDILLKIQKLLK